jgi:hypothetical protein
VRTTSKPLSASQRRQLEAYVAKNVAAIRAAFLAVGLFFAGVIFRAIQLQAARRSLLFDNPLWWMAPTFAIGVLLVIWGKRLTGGREFRANVRADLVASSASAHTVRVRDAILIEEHEDEGPGFVIETEEGATIVFAGQYLDPFVRRGFPWTAFDIIEAPRSQVFLDLVPQGESVTVTKARGPLTWQEVKQAGLLKRKYAVIIQPTSTPPLTLGGR